MKKTLLITAIVILFFTAGCVKIDQNKIYSISEFMEASKHFNDQDVNIQGLADFKYTCPKCVAGTKCAPCASPYIIMQDPLAKVPVQTRIIINFKENNETYNSLKLFEPISINAHYLKENPGAGASNGLGYFIFNSLNQ